MMKRIQTLFCLSIIIFALSGNALALNIHLKKEEVEDAIKHGEEFAKDIFKMSGSKTCLHQLLAKARWSVSKEQVCRSYGYCCHAV